MVAPNGARKVKTDHPQVPLDAGEIAAVARDCADAGAGAIHYHVRDAEGGHILDAGRYHEATAELQRAVPPTSREERALAARFPSGAPLPRLVK